MLMVMRFVLLIIFSVIQLSAGANCQQKRVYVDVCADLMHAGHIEFFKKAREFGDYLIVGVLSDEDIASYKRVPILTLDERVAEVQACRYVDEVIAAPPIILTKEWLEDHQIDFVVHGDDLSKDALMYWYQSSIDKGIFRTVSYTKGISTTDIINRIKERYLTPNMPR